MTEKEREELIDVLTEFIIHQWEEETAETASFYAGEYGDEDAARSLISSFLAFCEDGKISPDGSEGTLACFHAVEKMLRRVLAVDMAAKSNRKGDLPRAMGLVSRRDAQKRLRDHVLYRAVECAREDTGVAGRPLEECYDLVAAALERSGKFGELEDGGVSPDSVKKVHQRTHLELNE